MNKLLNLAAAVLLAVASAAFAGDDENCQHPMGMMSDKALPNEAMVKMQEQMAKIRQTSDPAERQKLMQEHFQAMQEAMQALRGNAGTPGTACPQNCQQPMAGGNCQKRDSCPRPGAQDMATPPAAMPGMPQMQQRMDMMQMMMENMLEHQRQMQQNK